MVFGAVVAAVVAAAFWRAAGPGGGVDVAWSAVGLLLVSAGSVVLVRGR
ncbi:hypothetical protein [Kineosporia babensis]|uniref:Uncharacterized protein n=1 Tax=Kineosporia babensis TaxID=499548 RepID=A0A9X1NM61_9ACTN|nr:hypothetical protein [Kineosporia babensis]MCD5315633.1 hypothetical protein [Kineosporia babensis]